ncbi:cell surface protein, partial [Lactobacillus sp. UMNPBX9]
MKLIKSISLAAAALSLTAPAIALVNPSITTAQAATKKSTGT